MADRILRLQPPKTTAKSGPPAPPPPPALPEDPNDWCHSTPIEIELGALRELRDVSAALTGLMGLLKKSPAETDTQAFRLLRPITEKMSWIIQNDFPMFLSEPWDSGSRSRNHGRP
jgi:hypothetical protein